MKNNKKVLILSVSSLLIGIALFAGTKTMSTDMENEKIREIAEVGILRYASPTFKIDINFNVNSEIVTETCYFPKEQAKELIRQRDAEMKIVQESALVAPETNPIIYSNFSPVLPVKPEFYTITSPMGERQNPVTGETEYHYGVDIDTPGIEGQNVFAILPGVISNISSDKNLGTYVVVKHGDMSTLYANLNPDEVRSIVGQRVYSGDVIGVVGNSGNEGKPMLHFEVDIKGERVDPMTIMSGVKSE